MPPLMLETDRSSSPIIITSHSPQHRYHYRASEASPDTTQLSDQGNLVDKLSNPIDNTEQLEYREPKAQKDTSLPPQASEVDPENTKDPKTEVPEAAPQDSFQESGEDTGSLDYDLILDSLFGGHDQQLALQPVEGNIEDESNSMGESAFVESYHSIEDSTSDTIIVIPTPNSSAEKRKALKRSLEDSNSHKEKRLKPSMITLTPQAPKKLPVPKCKVFFHDKVSLDKPGTMQKLRELGILKVQDICSCDYYCVPKSSIVKRSPNILEAILRGKQPITDEWINVSVVTGHLVDLESYNAQNQELEQREWKTTLWEAVQRGKLGVKPLKGHQVAVTSTLKSNLGVKRFADLKRISILAGAKTVTVLGKVSVATMESSLICGLRDEALLKDIVAAGQPCFSIHAITVSILRGSTESAEDFLIAGDISSKSSKHGVGGGIEAK